MPTTLTQLTFRTYLRGLYKLNFNKANTVHIAIITSIYDHFIMAGQDLDQARLEMSLDTATGYWLDCWGDFFSIHRKSKEKDEVYRKRIINTIIRPKSTIPAIQDHTADYLNYYYDKDYKRRDIIIKEPFKEVGKYSHKGFLSHNARFISKDYYCHAVIDIYIPEQLTNDLKDLIKAVKAAGVKVYWSILFTYDIIDGFSKEDDVKADYLRHMKTYSHRKNNTGLVLSSYSPHPTLSGKVENIAEYGIGFEWYAKVKQKDTDESIILTKQDLIGVLDIFDYFEEKYDNGYYTIEHVLRNGTEILEILKFLGTVQELTYNGIAYTPDGVKVEGIAPKPLFDSLVKELKEFKEKYPDYYRDLQPPILNGDRVMWLVDRRNNWLWGTPTLSIDDLYERYEPVGKEHTCESIQDFEKAYYNGYITFADDYQPPIEIGRPKYGVTVTFRDWMYSHEIFNNSELEQLYIRQFTFQDLRDRENPTLEELKLLEKLTKEGYSVIGDEQPPIIITPITG